MFEHISCTELEASRVLGKKWTLAKTKLKAFIEIWYARRVYEKKKIWYFHIYGRENGDQTSFPTPWVEMILPKYRDLFAVIKKVIQVNVYKMINLLWYQLYRIGLFKIVRIAANQEQILQLTTLSI